MDLDAGTGGVDFRGVEGVVRLSLKLQDALFARS
jgi:hypothetical protein